MSLRLSILLEIFLLLKICKFQSNFFNKSAAPNRFNSSFSLRFVILLPHLYVIIYSTKREGKLKQNDRNYVNDDGFLVWFILFYEIPLAVSSGACNLFNPYLFKKKVRENRK